MKKITLLFLLTLILPFNSYGQCTTTTGGQYPSGVVTVLNNGAAETISTNNWPNAEISLLEGLVTGNTYTVTGTNTTSVYITVAETTSAFDSIGTVITHGDGTVSFTATTTEILIFWHLDSLCNVQPSDATLTTIQCTNCTCTAFFAPNVATTPTPANAATDVDISYGESNSISFEWVDAVAGETADTYNFNLGVTSSGDDIGTLNNVASGVNLLYDFQPNTTYYWSVDPVNCAGSTSGTVWSFTTSACTEISAPISATNPYPADAATGVSLQSPDGGLNFTWTGSGNPDDNYILNIGENNPPTQSFDFESGDPLTGLQVSTTYFWSIDVVNCFGITEGPVWSFTTDANLSTDDVALETFSVYPNPTSGLLNIKSKTDVDNVTVYNLLGQSVASFNKNQIIDSAINLSELSEGLYLVKITSGDKTQTLRVTKE